MHPMARPQAADARLETIRNLLAKADATPYPAEAEAYTAKASELMARYAIDEAMLWAEAGDTREEPAEVRIRVERPYANQKTMLITGVARALGCESVILGPGRDDGGRLVSVVGFPSDLGLVEALVTSLFVQLATAMAAEPNAPRGSASQVSNWRRSFIAAYATTVVTRLERDRRAAAAERDRTERKSTADDRTPGRPHRSTGLVLAERSDEVRAEYRKRYPWIRTMRISVGTSSSGHGAGRRAGERADIGNPRVGRRRELPGR